MIPVRVSLHYELYIPLHVYTEVLILNCWKCSANVRGGQRINEPIQLPSSVTDWVRTIIWYRWYLWSNFVPGGTFQFDTNTFIPEWLPPEWDFRRYRIDQYRVLQWNQDKVALEWNLIRYHVNTAWVYCTKEIVFCPTSYPGLDPHLEPRTIPWVSKRCVRFTAHAE